MISNDRQLDQRMLWALITVEGLVFYSFYLREVAPYLPRYFDQAFYLCQTYALQARVHTNGLGELWRALWSKDHASSLLLPIEGALSGLILGGARFPQLFVLYIAFCVLQIFVFTTARKHWGHSLYGFMVVGLILAQGTLWFWAGGLFDFRIDFLAYSLFGIWVCAVLRSTFFVDRRWAIGCGLIGAFLVFNRFLSVIYVVGISTGFAVACAIVWFLNRKDTAMSHRMRQRLFNLGLSLGILVIIVGPIFINNWAAIYNKYVYAQFEYEKDIRAREFGVFDLSGHLFYYPQSILRHHLGPSFLWASLIGIAGALLASLYARSRNSRNIANTDGEAFLLEAIFLLGCIFGPIVVLTIDVSKSPIIGGIVGVPAALLLASLVSRIVPLDRRKEFPAAHKLVLGSALAIFAIGLYNLFDQSSRHTPDHAQHRDLKQLTALNKWLVEFASNQGWHNPRISLDIISPTLNGGAITASGYEQSGEFIEFQPGLGAGGIMGIERSQALSSLAESDFVILTSLPKTGVYPFYEKISQYWGDLKTWADKNLIVAKKEVLDAFSLTVYVRPTAKIVDNPKGWVTSKGFSIEASHDVLQRFPVVRLTGPANYSWLPKVPVVSTTIETENGSATVPASFQRTNNGYEVLIDTSSTELPSRDSVRLSVTFDTFFVPKKLGINGDTRELVVPAPSSIQLVRREP
jgi:hypothetical protein